MACADAGDFVAAVAGSNDLPMMGGRAGDAMAVSLNPSVAALCKGPRQSATDN